jgi:hypothetical protein
MADERNKKQGKNEETREQVQSSVIDRDLFAA